MKQIEGQDTMAKAQRQNAHLNKGEKGGKYDTDGGGQEKSGCSLW